MVETGGTSQTQGSAEGNFQITMLICGVIAGILCMCGIGLVLLPVVAIVDLVFLIIASIKTSNGELYRYPLSIRLIK
jgi:hypothetical protein